ncbi:MAG: hypothetical protein Q4F02_00895 [Candidatus Saccharibacteria bacterium]|nr:hypothetical protein [Candidatus Saccharibacteria bacterium]
MEKEIGCQELCNPASGVCFLKAAIEHQVEAIARAQKEGIDSDNPQHVALAEKAGELRDCRMVQLARAVLELKN